MSLAVVPVAFVAVPLTAARLIVASKLVRFGAFLLLGAYIATRGYRPGEGPLSPKMPVTIAPGKGIGATVHELTKKFQGETFVFTRSEANSLGYLIEAARETPGAIPALEDFLEHFPAGRRYQAYRSTEAA